MKKVSAKQITPDFLWTIRQMRCDAMPFDAITCDALSCDETRKV